MKLIQISDFKLGRSIQGFYLCKEKHLRQTRSGDLFLDMVFTDSTGTIPGKLWDLVDKFQNRFKSGDPVAVKGKVTEYNDHLQLTVTQVNQATDRQYGKYGYSQDLLIKKVEEPVDVLWKRLSKLVDTLPNPYKKLTKSIFQTYEHKIKTIPWSAQYHPQLIRGGYLKHIVTTGEMVVDISPHYPSLDKSLALCGMLLHDIGKIDEINDSFQLNNTEVGRLIGHAVLGRDIVREVASSIDNIPEEILLKLEHIILSHTGFEDTGAKVEPICPEALFIHYMDVLYSKMNIMLETMVLHSKSK